MKNVNQLMQEIISISSTIESDYPELYKYLDETPFKICETNKNEICISVLFSRCLKICLRQMA
jgi:hypothetical protein